MTTNLIVTASGSCGGYRPLRRSPMAGTASIHLGTTHEGIGYHVEVSLWDLAESVNQGLYDGHDIEIEGRRYVTHDREPSPLPVPVRVAMQAALGNVYQWMRHEAVPIDRVLTWGKIAGEKTEHDAKEQARQRDHTSLKKPARSSRSAQSVDGT